ncbi:GDSL-type esterase/lipase family protein [bacterium]|nr:GDSL-type esterase/lipase family protein [bacterium]
MKKNWIVFRHLLLRPQPKGQTASERQEATRIQIALAELNKDAARVKETTKSLSFQFSTKILPHWRKGVVLALLFLPLLEIFLQFTSLLVWPLIKLKEAPSRMDQFVILCVGDSFTSGKFSSIQMPPYVRFLSEFLAAKKKDSWQVLNFSSAYLTAGDVLRGTHDLLSQQRPDLIYLMIGINDIAVEDTDKFVLLPRPVSIDSTRTPLHVEFLHQKIKDGFSLPDFLDVLAIPPSFLLEKSPIAGYRPEYLAISDSRLNALVATPSAVMKTRQHSQDFAASVDQQKSAWNLAKDGLFISAGQEFQNYLKTNPENAVARAGLAETYFEMGMHKEARAEISWLRDNYKREPIYKNARALLYAFPLENSPNDTSKIAVEVLKQYPGDAWFWKSLATACFLSSRPDYAARAIDRALALSRTDPPEWRAIILRTRADILARTNPDQAFENLLQAFLLDESEDLFSAALRRNGPYYLNTNLQKSLRSISCPAAMKHKLEIVYHQALDKKLIQTLFELETQLRSIVLRCQEYQIHPILVGYPFPNAEIERVNRRVAEETGASWLNLSARFEDVINNDRQRKYIDDDHFTPRAGRKLAEWIANDAASRLIH